MDQQKTLLKSRNAIKKFLPRATSSVTFQSPPIYSPAKDKRSSEKTHYKSNLGIGFSGPLLSMIPADTRRKIKNNSDYAIVYEPTSPRVSCMGQVKCKYQKDKLQRAKNNLPSDKVARLIDTRTHNFDDDREETPKTDTKSKKKLGFKKIFSGVMTPRSGRKKKDMGNKISKAPLYLDKAPSLSTMKRFSSGRGKFSSIDWTKEIARMDEEESDDEQHVIVMPSSAPVVIRNSLGFDDKFIRVAGINKEPKKEINLWKRRTLPQPKPLQVN